MHLPRVVSCALAVLLGAAPAAAQQVTNPIPAPIAIGDIRIRIDDLVQFPATASTLGSKPDNSPSARARINFLRESPDGRLFVHDLRGQLYSLDANYQPQLYVDVDAANGGAGSIFPDAWFAGGLAAGLISFQFHPEFAANGQFYTIHLERAQDANTAPDFATVDMRTGGSFPVRWHTIVTEWTTPTPSAATWNAAGARRELLRVGTTADAYFHPYGDVQFNPTAGPGDPDYGLLYISGGDWGYINGAGAPQGSGTEGQPGQLQRLDTLAGTLLRIDPRSPSQTGGQAGFGDYTIPQTNPFVDGNPNTFDEIYAFGFRNGHRMAWDEDGTLFVNNVGHANLEEVERIVAGGNYGWGLREGTFINGNDVAHGGNGDADDVFAHTVPDALDVDFRGEEFRYPVAQYDHGEGSANAGGFVYHGDNLPQLQGKYIFGDIVRGRIFVADVAAMKGVDTTEPTGSALVEEVQLYTRDQLGVEADVTLLGLVGSGRADLRFGVDADGEIYVMTKTDGFLRKLVSDFSELVLTVDRATGAVSFSNPTGAAIDIEAYSIASVSGSLDPASGAWSSLTDQGLPGWVESSAIATSLAETNATSSLALSDGAQQSLGSPFAATPLSFGVNSEDLEFQYTTASNEVVQGIVEYVGQSLNNNLLLTVDPSTGEATLKNVSPFAVSIEGYSILSDAGSLEPANGDWNSLADQGVTGWQEAAPTATALSELDALAALPLPSGETFDLGALFDPNGARDLDFEFLIDGQPDATAGLVLYRFAADFDADGDVDAGDLTHPTLGWKARFGVDLDGGDFLTWQRQLGLTGGDAAPASSGVPEPAAIWLAIAGALAAVAQRVHRRRPGS